MRLTFLSVLLLFVQIIYAQPSSNSGVEILYEYSLEQIKPIIDGNEHYQPFSKYVKNGIKAYKVICESSVHGRKVLLSGSILIPSNENNPKVVIFCHGTQFDQNVSSTWNSPFHIEALPALNGYITLIPDYFGYGVSEGEVPTYFDKHKSIVHLQDFIEGSLALLEAQSISYSQEINLIGFSQGGHLALSFAEILKNDSFMNIPVRNIISIGGPTDIVRNFRYIIGQDSFIKSGYLSYIIGVHNYYHWDMNLSNIFRPPYDQFIADFVKGKTKISELNEKTPNQMDAFFQPAFRNENSHLFKRAMKFLNKNSVKPFKINIPLTFVHSRSDEDVPFEFVNNFYLKIRQLNKGNQKISLLEVSGDHITSGLFGMGEAMDVLDCR
ncbi:alpha/beta hydrolase [Fulvivirgaceae bacterium BMA10]|uniref:Alpha/beta hydrolase n=1 Tax=Splendidivirga corallicola TaxID=3051826 RepID=A0ABT8KPS6_9BACT|nr:alpha/beta hydrolase [Fulvivirgaceae bacterium BMA10]